MKHSRSVLMVLAMFFLAGCATIVNRSQQTITVNSSPNEANILINGNVVGKTPWTGDVPRKSSLQITVSKEGYESAIIPLDGRVSGWFWGNIICGGLLGSTTDAVSGGIYSYEPGSYHAALKMTTGTKEEVKLSERDSKIKRFVLVNWADISRELSGTPGERVDALRELMGYGHKPLIDFAKMIKPDLEKSKDIDAFAEAMITLTK